MDEKTMKRLVEVDKILGDFAGGDPEAQKKASERWANVFEDDEPGAILALGFTIYARTLELRDLILATNPTAGLLMRLGQTEGRLGSVIDIMAAAAKKEEET